MIQASFIFEMMGKPANHVKKTLKEYVEKLCQEKNITLLSKNIARPKQLENNLFSTFAEVEIETEELIDILRILFTYMPSHVEITKPEKIILNNTDFNSIANELLMRLHKYDEVAKTVNMEKTILENQLKQLGVQPITEKLEQTQQQAPQPKKKTKSKTKKKTTK